MDPCAGMVISISEASGCAESAIGGKAAKLAALAGAGFRVPQGFCITSSAYERFLVDTRLAELVRMEFGRKPLETMRWEELWDAALRVRALFASADIPAVVAQAIDEGVSWLGASIPLAVRSSAPGEDDTSGSFAGIHESVIGVVGSAAVLDAVRTVWASLFSDAAILYRKELGLDPMLSRMAVVVQPVVDAAPSGVAFGRDPTAPALPRSVVEAVPGPCADLVDGLVEPDRWLVDRSAREVIEWKPGDRGGTGLQAPLLEPTEVSQLIETVQRVEALLRFPPDVEWTGRGHRTTLLQARPITTAAPDGGDERRWYLSLRPSRRRLESLARRVTEQLIPELRDLGERLAQAPLEPLGDRALADELEVRYSALEHWRQVYHDEFIPFAHGVRQLGVYYNDAVRPNDPYEFVELLRGEAMSASKRNAEMARLAAIAREHGELGSLLRQVVSRDGDGWQQAMLRVQELPGGGEFVDGFERLLTEFMDVAYAGGRLSDQPHLVLTTIVMLASETQDRLVTMTPDEAGSSMKELESRLFDAVGPGRREEAEEVLAMGRLSWKLRDDDNLLLGRVESQLLRAIGVAERRLRQQGRIAADAALETDAACNLARALRDRATIVTIPSGSRKTSERQRSPGEGTPRQLVGQPAARGSATGRVRRVMGTSGMAEFLPGEVLVCDAIQPMMTHLVPLASAIVERRGGMLIHGAIIARELGIPCVNGVLDAVQVLRDGEIVTVDGYLGIVTVGPPEFRLEGIDLVG